MNLPSLRWWLAVVCLCGGVALADHGPGTTGSSARTPTGNTLSQGEFSLSLDIEWTGYEDVSPLEALAAFDRIPSGSHIHYDTLHSSLLSTAELQYGVTDRVTFSLGLGLYRGDDLAGVHNHGSGPEYQVHGDVTGIADPWLRLKVQALRSYYGKLAVLGGLKLPLGRDDVLSQDDGLPLEPAVQPGSGALDFSLGLAYSVTIDERWGIDTGLQHSLRGENDGYRLGDRTEFGLAASYRVLGESEGPSLSLFAEVSGRRLLENEEEGETAVNTGGTALFGSLGVNAQLSDEFLLRLAPMIPLSQRLNSEQQETDLKIVFGLTITPR